MSLSLCVLGSGSAGNCTIVSYGRGRSKRHLLIDAGFSPRATAARLAPLNVRLDDIQQIVLTHLDDDHFYSGWVKVIARRGIRVHLHHRHRRLAWQLGIPVQHTDVFNGEFSPGEGIRVKSAVLAHDDLGSAGLVFEHAGLRLGYATDVGRITPAFFDHFTNLDSLAIESNYDREMELAALRPWFVKRRVMGGRGHLSNEQALEAVVQVDADSPLSHVVLLHLSRQCNDPELLRSLYLRRAPHLLKRLTLSDQFQPTPVVRIARRRAVVTSPRTAAFREQSLFQVG